MLAATNAAAVEIFNVLFISPPVPHVSIVFSGLIIFKDFFLNTLVAPKISVNVSPLIFRAVKNDDIIISLTFPSIILLKIKLDSLTVRSFCSYNLFIIWFNLFIYYL